MTKNYIPTINISSLIRDEFKTQNALKIIKKIEKACVEVGFFQVTGHGIDIKKINNICKIGNRFFNSSEKNKNKLAPKKWNNKNKNLYRGYFPNTVNGKEGLDLGDLKITLKHVRKYKSKYIEYLDLKKSLNKTSIKSLSNYFDEIFSLSEILFKSIIKVRKSSTFFRCRALVKTTKNSLVDDEPNGVRGAMSTKGTIAAHAGWHIPRPPEG